MQDSSEDTAANATLRAQKRALELAVTGAPLREILDLLVRTMEGRCSNSALGSIMLVDEATGTLRHGAAPSLPAEINAAVEGTPIGPDAGSCGCAAYTRAICVVADVESDPRWRDFGDLVRRYELRANWSMPILSPRGGVLGTFAIYCRHPGAPNTADLELVELLAHTAGLVIEREHEASRRSTAEAQLEATREHQVEILGQMLEHAPMAISLVSGREHVFQMVNIRYRELVGDRAVLGKTVRQAFPEIEGQGFFELMDAVRTSGRPYIGGSQRALFRRRPDAEPEEGFFDLVYQPLLGSDGKTERILMVAYEVTELVRAKLEAERSRALAEQSEDRLRTFIDNLPELAWTARADGHVDYYNRRWYEYTGTTFEEMQGWGWEKLHDPELLPIVKERWQRSLGTGEPFEMEFTLLGADGLRRWFLTRVSPLRDPSGAVHRWFGTNTNIADIKAAQALGAAMAEQSRDVQRMLLELRAEKDRAETRLKQLEAERARL